MGASSQADQPYNSNMPQGIDPAPGLAGHQFGAGFFIGAVVTKSAFQMLFKSKSSVCMLRTIDTKAGVLSRTTDGTAAMLAFTDSRLAKAYLAAKQIEATCEAREFSFSDAVGIFAEALKRGEATDLAIDPTPGGTAGNFRVFPLLQVLVWLESS